jgi:hypothetical protein
MAFSTLVYYKQNTDPSTVCNNSHDVPSGLTQHSGDQYIVYYDQNKAQDTGVSDGASLSDIVSNGLLIFGDSSLSGTTTVPVGSWASTPFDGTQSVNTDVFVGDNTLTYSTTCNSTITVAGFNPSNATVTEGNTPQSHQIPVVLQNYSSPVSLALQLNQSLSTVEPTDITIDQGSLNFSSNGTQAFTININSDTGSNNEVAVFDLVEKTSPSTGIVLSPSTYTLNITDDEGLTSPNGNSIITVYYKSYNTIQDVYGGNRCAGLHEVLYDTNGNSADQGNTSGTYKLYYDSNTGSGLTLAQLQSSGIKLFVDDAQGGNFTQKPESGYVSENPFDGSQIGTFDNYYLQQGRLVPDGEPQQCTGNGTPNPTTRLLEVYATDFDPSNPSDVYCDTSELIKTGLYYLHSEEFTTIEQLIYHVTYVDTSMDIYFSQNCPLPDPLVIADPLTPPPGVELFPFNVNMYVGDSLTEFYAYNPDTGWLQSEGKPTNFNSLTTVPNADPDSSPSSWVAWSCGPLNPNATQIDLQYASIQDTYCGNASTITYYYFNGGAPLSFQQILNTGQPLFTDLQSAIDYYYCPVSPQNLSPNGVYGEDNLYYHGYDPNQALNGDSPWLTQGSCILLNPTVRSIFVKVPQCDVTSITLEICEYPTDEIEVFYSAGIELNLLQIARNGIDLYTTSDGALNSDTSKLILGSENLTQIKAGDSDNSIESDEYFFYRFNNGAYYYEGANGEHTIIGPNLTMDPRKCLPLNRPLITLNEEVDTGGFNVFYAFYACQPSTPSQSGYTFNNYAFYVIDGLHQDGDTSVISDLIAEMKVSNNLVLAGETNGSCQCLEYVHKIKAIDFGSALSFLSNYYPNIVDANPVEIGIGSQQTVTLYPNCTDCRDEVNGTLYEMPEYDTPEIQEPGPNMDIEKNYKLDNVSKPLLRTNPKLSTNVKLVVDSQDNIYLDSFNANQNLADSKYKRYELSEDSNYAYDLARYYSNTNTPIDSTFDVLREYSDLSVHDQYRKQLEEEYQYGTKLNASKLYDEEYRLLAPIWLDLNVPKKFVIYRVNDPGPVTTLGDGSNDKLDRVLQLVKNSQIVKVFDLSKQSAIGKYLRSHVQDEFFPESTLTITMEEGEKSTYNGIDLIKGGFVEKGEYIYNDFVRKDLSMTDANDFITDGFRRNKVASANLINLEFMFDDPSANGYSVNRYFGLYVDDFESGVGEVAYTQNGIIKFKSIQSNMDSLDTTFAIPEHRLLKDTGLLAFAKIKEDFYTLDPLNSYDAKRFNVSINTDSSEIESKLGIFNKGVSASFIENKAADSDYIKFQIIEAPATNDIVKVSMIKKESVRFKLIKNVNSETLTITDFLGNYIEWTSGIDANDTWNNLYNHWADIEGHVDGTSPIRPAPNQSEIDFYNRYELDLEIDTQIKSIVFTERKSNLVDNQLYVTSSGSSLIAQDEIYTNVDPLIGNFFADGTGSLPKKRFTDSTFSALGSNTDIAFALAGAIRNNSDFDAYNIGDNVYVKSKVNGYNLRNAVLLVGALNQNQFIRLENEDINNDLNLSDEILTLFDSYYLTGGNSAGKSIYATSETADVINVGDFLPTQYPNAFNEILHIAEDTVNRNGEQVKLILKEKTTLSSKDYDIYFKNKVTLGLFSAYNVYDMDFDFYDTSNSELKELNLETSENISYTPYEYAKNPQTGSNTLSEDVVIGPGFDEDPITYFANLLPLLQGEDPDSIATGKISSEYDRLNENYTKEYSTNSRIVPFINKWVLKDSMTVREEPYHLNVNEAFGRTNFSPDLTVEGRNPNAFTHEWFYIDNWPTYFNPPTLSIDNLSAYSDDFNKGFSYVNFANDFEITKSIFKSTRYDYFDRLMVSEGTETTVQIDDNGNILNPTFWSKTNLTRKYTIIGGGSEVDFGSTVFKGLKFFFKKRKDGGASVATEFVKNSDFNGYRFSILAKTKTGSTTNSVDYEFIKNDTFKFIILFIEINVDDASIGFINRKLLYELNNKIIFSPVNGVDSYAYANVNIDGAIDLGQIQFNGPGPYIAKGLEHSNGSIAKFNQQISPSEGEIYGSLRVDYGQAYTPAGEDIFIDIVNVVSNDEIQIKGRPYYIDANTQQQVELNPSAIPLAIQLAATYTYIGGGVNLYDTLFTLLSANSFNETLKNNPNEIGYTTVNVDGTEVENQYSIGIDDGNEIIKESVLVSNPDTDAPKAFKLSKETIGFNIEEANPYYPFLIRHGGKYTVDLTPVITFTDVYGFNKVLRDHRDFNADQRALKEPYYKLSLSSSYEVNKSLAYYKKFNRLGVAFNVDFISDDGTHDRDWGMIKNHFYHKINEINTLGVTKLSESSEYLPQYPLINEIAIDKRNINVFRSSWEDNYYVRSAAGGEFEFIPGTISTLEEKSYLGSSAIKTKDSYSIYEFTVSNVTTESELDEILRNSNNSTDVVFFEDDTNIFADFYMDGLIANVIGDDGLAETIKKFVEPEKSAGDKDTVTDDVTLYALNNMVPLYGIDSIEIFTRNFKGSGSEIISTNSIDLIDNDGYISDESFTYRLHSKKSLNFRLIYNKKLGYSYSIRALIKIQS